jgi:predicted transcriptional regulator
LRGFFAGEGNLKEGAHKNRTVRIAQKQRIEIIDSILGHFNIKSIFSERERAYVITGRNNWEKLAKLNIADLHPDKKRKFWKIYNEFKEWHYGHDHIKNEILKHLETPKTSNELSHCFDRTQSRIQMVLTRLKRKGLVNNFRVQSKDFWIRADCNVIIISNIKQNYLDSLNVPRTTKEMSNIFNVDWKSSYRRLTELKNLGLVKREGHIWSKATINKEVKIL